MLKEIKIPEISENVESGTVVVVLVEMGQMVDVDDSIIELETDKAVVEIPTPYKGKITEILVKEGDEVNIGAVIARVETEVADLDEEPEEVAAAEIPEDKEIEEAEPEKAPEAEPVKEAVEATPKEEPPPPPKEIQKIEEPALKRGPAPASPSVRRLARELGVDIHTVQAGGPGARITEADVKAHVKKMRPTAAAPGPAAGRIAAHEPVLPDFSRWGEVEAVDLPTIRRITAESVAVSWHTVPHVTQFDRADITTLQEFLDKHSDRVAQAGGKLTVTAVLMKVCAEALRKFPNFNASIDPANNKLILKHYVHIGLMVDTPHGLLAPIVRDADSKSITDLALEIVDLAERTRKRKVKPDELEGGTFSISNQGGIGGTNFTPIVLWPQAAILGVSRSAIEPRYIKGEFRPRMILPLSLSYDHRIIDGADAARFLRWVCESLAYPFTMHLD
jgi:pyruvate dehydrogenase E2 component (dihydrolipoamide acetyltransferase)